MTEPGTRRLRFEVRLNEPQRRIQFHAWRWVSLPALAVLTYVLFPVARGFEVPVPEVGEVALAEVLAPFEFEVFKTEAEMQREADAVAATVRPIYDDRRDVADSVIAHLEALFTAFDSAESGSAMLDSALQFGLRLTGEGAQYLQGAARRQQVLSAARRMVSRYLVQGVPPPGTIEDETSREILVRRGEQESVRLKDSVITRTRFLDLRATTHPDPNSSLGDQVFVKILNVLFRPTLIPNVAETEAARAELRATIDPKKDEVRANERIINAHEVVTPEARDRLVALRAELLRRGGAGEGNLRGVLGQILTNALILSVFWLMVMLYRPDIYRQFRQVLVFAVLFVMVVVGSAVNLRIIGGAPELIPIPFAAIVATVLFTGRISMVAAMVVAVLVGSQAVYGGLDAVYVALIGGVAAALSVRGIRRRTHILSSAGIVAGAFALAAVTVGLRVGWSLGDVGLAVLRGASNGTVSAALVFLALPMFESLARVTTDLSLLELSDPNRPLLRRLATEAPGTYAHSVAMANLCEAGCNAIGANGLLARVGCYYHDVGKLHRPHHFAENQGPGGNPHDRLPPDVSATIVRNHVTEGVALVEEQRLPEAVKAFVPEHHGTMEITYFLERARQQGEVPEESLELYRYPGPLPNSAETAVAMLADGVEAALRVLEDPSPKKLADAIDHVVKRRVEAGQLIEAPLTLAQLERVKGEFVRTLSGMYHNRIEYPAESGGITANWQAASGA
jgi:putative nucleotidyltransferase with HDIG domain